MISNRLKRGLALAALLVLGGLGGCATTTQYNGYVDGGAQARRAVEAGRYSPRATAQIAIVQNPDLNGGKISHRAFKKIQEYSLSCQRQIDAQLAGAGQSMFNGAVPYGVAGAGAGPAAKAAFPGAKLAEYAKYGGIAYFFAGAQNGLVTGSYAMASAKGNCTKDFWNDVDHTNPAFRGTHVEVVFAGKKWGNSAPPALDHSAIVQPEVRPRTRMYHYQPQH